MHLKILSWNIWVDGNFNQIAEFLKHEDADIIGLQEMKDNDSKRDIIGFLTSLGYQHVFAPVEKHWGGKTYRDGPAIFSKFPITHSETHLLSENDTRAVVRADIKISGEIFHVFSTHLLHTHQKESATQNEQAENLLKLLPKERTVVMGDFNATPESRVIQKMQKVLVDSDPESHPTWSLYPQGCITCNPQDVSIQLDYIFTTKDISFHSFSVGQSKASDHLPVSTIINL